MGYQNRPPETVFGFNLVVNSKQILNPNTYGVLGLGAPSTGFQTEIDRFSTWDCFFRSRGPFNTRPSDGRPKLRVRRFNWTPTEFLQHFHARDWAPHSHSQAPSTGWSSGQDVNSLRNLNQTFWGALSTENESTNSCGCRLRPGSSGWVFSSLLGVFICL